MKQFSLICAVSLLQAAVNVCGCATSFAPDEASTSLTAGPQAEPEIDEEEIRVQQLFIRGLTRALVDDHRQAIFLFEQALQIDSEQPAILHALAESHAALRELDTALYYSQRAFRLEPSNRAYMMQHVDLQQRSGDPDGALETYEEWLTVYPGDVETRFLAGELMIRMGREQEALAQFRDIIANEGENIEARYRILQLYNGMGNVDGMLQTAEALREIDPTNNALLMILASIHVERNQIDQAIEVLEQAVENDASDIDAVMTLVQLYRETGRYDDADRLTASAATDPVAGDASRIAMVSELYSRAATDQAAAEEAESVLLEIIQSGEGSPETLIMLGNLWFRDGRYTEASEVLLQALDSDPRHPDEWARAATSLFRSGDVNRAEEVAEEGLMLFPGQYPLLSIAAEIALGLQNYERALEYAGEAAEILEQNGGDNRLKAHTEEQVGDAYAGLQDPKRAQTHWQRALEFDPDSDSVRRKLHPNP